MEMTREKIAALVADVVAQKLEEQNREPTPEAVTFDDMVKAMQSISRPLVSEVPKADRGIGAARFIRAMAAGKADPERAAKWAKKQWGADDPMTKILEASEDAAGGVLIPTQHSNEVIELLRERAVFRGMSPTTVPMPTGSLQIPKITGGATATYIGESQNIVKTEQTTGMVNLTWKKLAALVPISNDFLRYESYGADSMVRNDLVAAMADREDIAFIRGDGTEFTPKGLLHFAPAANKFDANATVNIDNITADVMQAILKLRNAHVRMINVGWLWSPRTTLYLKSLRDTNSNFVFKAELDAGTFFGFPYDDTTNIPDDLGASTESEVYLCDFADVVLGESMNMMIDTSTEASYWDGSALQSAYSKDLTLMRVISEHDLGVRHDASIVVIEAVKWHW
jgi:HK97 family phage major capsid protein